MSLTPEDMAKAKELATALQERYPEEPFKALAAFRKACREAGRLDADNVARIAAKVLILRGAPGWQACHE